MGGSRWAYPSMGFQETQEQSQPMAKCPVGRTEKQSRTSGYKMFNFGGTVWSGVWEGTHPQQANHGSWKQKARGRKLAPACPTPAHSRVDWGLLYP